VPASVVFFFNMTMSFVARVVAAGRHHMPNPRRFSLFPDRAVDDLEVRAWTGLPSAHELERFVHDTIHHRSRLHVRWRHNLDEAHAVTATLIYLRTELSVVQIASLQGISSPTLCQTVIDECMEVISHLAGALVAGALSYPVSPSEQMKHYHQEIRADTITCIIDNTYWFTDIPSDIRLGRKLRDKLFKKRSYIKMGVHVCMSGYIFGVYGPFACAGGANDALTLTSATLPGKPLHALALLGGHWLADTGYRGTRTPPSSRSDVPLVLDMTPLKKKSSFGMSSDEVIQQRRVTRYRWVVEVVNAHLKMFRRLRVPLHWGRIDKALVTLRCVAFLHNRYHNRFNKSSTFIPM
jgi:hypothetical protein